MRIAIVGPASPREFSNYLGDPDWLPVGLGGIPVNELIRSLLLLGHQVCVFTVSQDVSEVWRAGGNQLEITVVPFRTRARARAMDFFRAERQGLAAALRSTKADIFHAHWTYEFTMACVDAGVGPLIVTAHDAPLTILRRKFDAYRFFRTLLAFRARMNIRNLTAVSPSLARRWRYQMLFLRPISIVPNPIPPLERIPRRRSNQPTLLEVADGSRLKNVSNLIRAFAVVLKDFPDAKLRLVGPGLGADEKMARWALRNGLTAGVKFRGVVDRTTLATEYANATLFCHASLEESQGMCLLEAMAARVPIIAGSKSGGVGWTLFDGDGGALVDVASVAALSSAIVTELKGRELAGRVDSVASAANGRYAGSRVAQLYLQEYLRVIRDGSLTDMSSNRGCSE